MWPGPPSLALLRQREFGFPFELDQTAQHERHVLVERDAQLNCSRIDRFARYMRREACSPQMFQDEGDSHLGHRLLRVCRGAREEKLA